MTYGPNKWTCYASRALQEIERAPGAGSRLVSIYIYKTSFLHQESLLFSCSRNKLETGHSVVMCMQLCAETPRQFSSKYSVPEI